MFSRGGCAFRMVCFNRRHGLGAGLRQGMFDRVQDFAFSNVDRFSTASLVTRLTTDVNRVQMTFMMLIAYVCARP